MMEQDPNSEPVVVIHEHPPSTWTSSTTGILPRLQSHLPYSIPLLRRIQHHLAHPTSTATVLATFPAVHQHETPRSTAAAAPKEEPWLTAYIDLHAGRETQVVIYSSAEADSSVDVSLPSSATNAPGPTSTGTGSPLSLSLLSSQHSQTIRRQLLALFQYIKTHLLPEYTAHLAAAEPVTATATATDHQLPPPPPQAFLIGNLHTGLLAVLFAGQTQTEKDEHALAAAYTSGLGSVSFVPGLKVHRYDHAPYVKYLFGREVVCPRDGSATAEPAKDGFRFHTRDGRQGVQRQHFALVRSRTVIPRSDATLAMLPGAAVYAQTSGTVDGGEEEETENPVAWAFLGPDGSLATLHVEAEYRGQGLAGRVAREAMRRGMVEDGRWWNGEGEGEEDTTEDGMLVHTNVAMGNGASRRVMEKLGGRVGWTVTWTVVEVLQ
ncbi:hypothetical protein ASPACDRAFT_120898 [Aspergillus aculeatus ATCC 16872]|uniref:FR47-like domain-containing protein n=1 Tax=Aspergillus aculeatus (strain ATCC 16872 / CBS 172.66 / WB 5094) TaxID=690307 RepID=A0A1L9WTB9_ASPA1|nr:uncharacterized protein ASPACDRAFT_120898 [Aspergillus aculeatus ATCC 16872]OJJ99454.1 hypothetical protein ASPACDRAFT_120898 [Aspergillus aculeatus ATCC 16872]